MITIVRSPDDVERAPPGYRAWLKEAVRKVQADANRSADTHLLRFPLEKESGYRKCRVDGDSNMPNMPREIPTKPISTGHTIYPRWTMGVRQETNATWRIGMSSNDIVEVELNSHDWSKHRTGSGTAEKVPSAIRELISAQSADEVKTACWQLENHVVVQGIVHESALHLIPVLMAILVDQNRPKHIRIATMELMFQILHGTASQIEVDQGMGDLDAKCKERAKEGLWLLRREALGDAKAGPVELLSLLERKQWIVR